MVERSRATTPADLPDVLPVFPLPGALLLPRGRLPLNIFEPRYLNMVEDALAKPRLIGMIQPAVDDGARLVSDGVRLFAVGCAGRIASFAETGDGRYLMTLEGVIRFRVVEELAGKDGYRRVKPDFTPYLDDFLNPADPAIDDRPKLIDAMRGYFRARGIEADEKALADADDSSLVTALAMSCPFDPSEKQAILECIDDRARGALLTEIMRIAAAETTAPAPSTRQ
jgi:Lon protease-like protein